jgi:hypothetical protein
LASPSDTTPMNYHKKNQFNQQDYAQRRNRGPTPLIGGLFCVQLPAIRKLRTVKAVASQPTLRQELAAFRSKSAERRAKGRKASDEGSAA